MARNINTIDYGVYTVTDTAALFLSFGTPATLPTSARSFKGRLETASLRARGDGTAPTATEGELIEIGDDVILDKHQIMTTNFIRTGSTSGVLRGHFYNVEASVLLGGGP